MSDNSPEEVAPKRSNFKTSFEVGITMALITSSEYIDPAGKWDLFAKLTRIFAPLLGLVISGVVNYYVRGYEDDQDEKRIEDYINTLEFQIRDQNLSRERKKALIQEQILHHEDLSNVRRGRAKRRLF